SKDFITRAWRYKHLFGGAMRQSGMLAAAGIHALEHHVDRLKDDHANAKLLAQGLGSIKRIRVENPNPPTNILFFDISQTGLTGPDFHAKAQQAGVRFSGGGTRVRAVTHLDISREHVERAVEIVAKVLSH